MPLTVLLSRTLHPLAQWSWETALRSRHEAHLARFGHGHCFILIRSRPCALPLSQRGVAETRHCFALNSSLIPGSFSAGLRRTTRKHSLATPMSDFLFRAGRGGMVHRISFLSCVLAQQQSILSASPSEQRTPPPLHPTSFAAVPYSADYAWFRHV